jgi:hypothetical protein
VDAQRKQLNDFIRQWRGFDGVLDFDRAVLDPTTGRLRPEMAHDTTVGGEGDGWCRPVGGGCTNRRAAAG